jgi:hypothetical protein
VFSLCWRFHSISAAADVLLVDPEEVPTLLHLANFYSLGHLQLLCERFLSLQTTASTAVEVLGFSELYGLSSLRVVATACLLRHGRFLRRDNDNDEEKEEEGRGGDRSVHKLDKLLSQSVSSRRHDTQTILRCADPASMAVDGEEANFDNYICKILVEKKHAFVFDYPDL